MHIGKHNPKAYSMKSGNGRIELERVTREKDLGVLVSDDLKPSSQCKAAAKAINALRNIKQSFRYITVESFHILYNTYVRPHLEYYVQALSPYLQKDITLLENIQRRATKLVKGLEYLPYERRLHHLNLYSLEQRRIRGDLIEVFKLMHNERDLPADQFFKRATTISQQPRDHSQKLYKGQSRTQLCQNFFTQRVVDQWNRLPLRVINTETVVSFKAALDKYTGINARGASRLAKRYYILIRALELTLQGQPRSNVMMQD